MKVYSNIASMGFVLLAFSLLYSLNGYFVWSALFSGAMGYALYWYLETAAARVFKARPSRPGIDSVLVTGGSKGIGLSLAKLFARDGFNVVIAAQDERELEQAKQTLEAVNPNIRVHWISTDLTKDGATQQLIDQFTDPSFDLSREFRINHLINNAAMGYQGKFLDATFDQNCNTLKLNVLALTELTYKFGSWMKLQARLNRYPHETFRILNVSSLVAFTPSPKSNLYSATKSFVQSLSVGLYEELSGEKLTVSCLCPGVTKTDLMEREYGDTLMTKLFQISTPDEVADVGYRCMMTGQRYAVVGMWNALSSIAFSMLPYPVTSKLMSLLNSKPGEIKKSVAESSLANKVEPLKQQLLAKPVKIPEPPVYNASIPEPPVWKQRERFVGTTTA